VGRDIDWKLCLTAAYLGTPTRKDLASAFHATNPSTSFDLERAHKWLQARAKPREPRLYDDWAQLLKLGQNATWIAEASIEDFLQALLDKSDLDRDTLIERAQTFGGGRTARSSQNRTNAPELVGTYVCYSHAWSPYFRGRLIRSCLEISAQDGGRRLTGTYTESLPNGVTSVEGPVVRLERALHLDLRHPTESIHLLFCLFPPSPPGSVLGGLMCGATILGPTPQPSVSRIIMIKLPHPPIGLANKDAYLPANGSVATDLVDLGLPISDMALTDRTIQSFLSMRGQAEFDQVPIVIYHELVAMFDCQWLSKRQAGQQTILEKDN
jgi:hypothetical protein